MYLCIKTKGSLSNKDCFRDNMTKVNDICPYLISVIYKKLNFLLSYMLNSVRCAITDTGVISTAQVTPFSARLELKIISIFSCTARNSLCNADPSFKLICKLADADIICVW